MIAVLKFCWYVIPPAIRLYNGLNDTLAPPQKLSMKYLYGGHSAELEKDMSMKFAPFFRKHGVRKDVQFHSAPTANMARVFGTNFIKEYPPHILMTVGFQNDRDALLWVLKHEICHIKRNDMLWIPFVRSASDVAFTYFLHKYFTFKIVSLLAVSLIRGLASFFAMCLFSQYEESIADSFSNKNCSEQELRGGIRFLRSVQEMTETFDLMHPSLKSRIEKIEKEILSRSLPLQDPNQDQFDSRTLKNMIRDGFRYSIF